MRHHALRNARARTAALRHRYRAVGNADESVEADDGGLVV